MNSIQRNEAGRQKLAGFICISNLGISRFRDKYLIRNSLRISQLQLQPIAKHDIFTCEISFAGRLILIVATLQLQLPVCLWVNVSRSDLSKTVAKKHSCCCGCCQEESTTGGDESSSPQDSNRDGCPCHYQCCLCSP